MPSWQSRAASLAIRALIKRRFHANEDEMVRHLRRRLGRPRLVKSIVDDEMVGRQVNVMGVKGEWLDWKAARETRTLLYLHGGGYVACSSLTHRPITVSLTRHLHCRTFVPDYRLAPECRFPAAIDDAVNAYRGLLARQIDPKEIVVAGDSAGGGLALAMVLTLRREREPLPAAVACLSPWVDLAGTGASLASNNRRDAMFFGTNVTDFARVYLGDVSTTNDLASPIYADLNGLPPLVVHVSDSEILLDDSLRLAARATECGVNVDLRVWKDLPHVWQIFAGLVPEAEASLSQIAVSLKRHLPPAN